ncbi:MAG: PAS domain-containing protein [Hyphomicrobiales bacterium]
MPRPIRSGGSPYLSEDYRQLLGLTEKEVIGAPHSLVRHPLMPAAVFHRLWVRLRAGRDFAFPIVNMTAAGDHFWAMARISPMREGNGAASGYHASLRVLTRDCIEEASEIYGRMRAVEGRCEDEREGIAASLSVLERALRGRRVACAELQAI